MAVIIEIRRRGGQLIERCRCEGDSFRVGRAYDNDVIVDDPFVSQHHIRLDQCEEGWKVTDLDSLNSYRIKSKGRTVKRDTIHSGEKMRIGEVTLRVFHTHHPVMPALKINGIERRLKMLGWHSVWPFVIIVALGMAMWDAYLKAMTEVKPMGLLYVAVSELVVVGGFALLWSLAGRIFRHQLRFFSHLSMWAIYAAVAQLGDEFAEIIAYNLGTDIANFVMGIFLNFALLALVVWSSLALSTNLRSRGRLWAAVGASLIYLSLQSLDVLRFQQIFTTMPVYQGGVKPPALTWASPEPEEKVHTVLESLFDEAEEEAKKEL